MCFYSTVLSLVFWILSALRSNTTPVSAGSVYSWYPLTSSSPREALTQDQCISQVLKSYAPVLGFSGRRYLQDLHYQPPPTFDRYNPVLSRLRLSSALPTQHVNSQALHSSDGNCARFFLPSGTDQRLSLGKLHDRN